MQSMAENNGRPKSAASTENAAVVFGATGLVGKELVKRLTSKPKWKVYGVARRPDGIPINTPNYIFISCDLLDAQETETKLSSAAKEVTHMFWITWASQFPLDSKECLEQNYAMMSNALNAILPKNKSLKHVSVQTGMKHYVSLEKGEKANEVCLYDENFPRVKDGCNFYYVVEDLIKEKLDGKVAWSVLRPGLIQGSSNRTLYNVVGCLCVYGSLCKYLNLPFVFGGSRECWEEVYIDGSDARLVAEHHIWAATNDELFSVDGQAFNSINGVSFTWKEMWPVLAKKFEVEEPKEMFSSDFRYTTAMKDKKEEWEEIVAKHGLVKSEIEDLANWDFLDALFRCPVKLFGKRDKSDGSGFTTTYKTIESMLHWIDSMRDDRLIP